MIQSIRPRRNRKSSNMRLLIEEKSISINDFIAPLFVMSGKNTKIEIKSMPGQFRFTLDLLLKEINELVSLGIKAICLFPALDESLKTSDAKEALNPNCLYYNSLKAIKDLFPELIVMTDVALDPYSSDGHDGLVDPITKEILNDQTVDILAKMSVLQASCGADIVGPSDMMDGRVGAIRQALESEGHTNTLIMSYTAKYASAFYGPFRDALDSTPKSGDKKTYQMNYLNTSEALRELSLDEQEGADIVMVKPGLPYLDVIKTFKDNTNLPISAYNVSGEYAMIKAASMNGWLEEDKVVLEMMGSFKRAGADMVLTYFSKDLGKILRNNA